MSPYNVSDINTVEDAVRRFDSLVRSEYGDTETVEAEYQPQQLRPDEAADLATLTRDLFEKFSAKPADLDQLRSRLLASVKAIRRRPEEDVTKADYAYRSGGREPHRTGAHVDVETLNGLLGVVERCYQDGMRRPMGSATGVSTRPSGLR